MELSFQPLALNSQPKPSADNGAENLTAAQNFTPPGLPYDPREGIAGSPFRNDFPSLVEVEVPMSEDELAAEFEKKFPL